MDILKSSCLNDRVAATFQIRRQQFRDRQGWDLSVNVHGEERDQYDDLRTTYVSAVEDDAIVVTCRLRHACHSTMAEDHFADIFGLSGPGWAGFGNRYELTRFCKAPEIGRRQCFEALDAIRGALHAHQLSGGHDGYVAVVYDSVARLLRMNGITYRIAATAPIDGKTAHLLLIDLRAGEPAVQLDQAA